MVSDNIVSADGSCGAGKTAQAGTRIDPQQAKGERLAAALRENLKRRKAQSRSRHAKEPLVQVDLSGEV